MSSSKLGDCLTCFRRTEHFVQIVGTEDTGDESVEAVLEEHFWFTKEEYSDRVVCSSCWEKIDDFHMFYCQVKQVYLPKLKKELKHDEDEQQNMSEGEANEFTFTNECETELKVIDVQNLKVEPNEENVNNSSSSSSSASSSSESDSESAVPVAKRKAPRLRRRKVKVKTDKPRQYSCQLCQKDGTAEAKSFRSWASLMKHFRETHKSNAYMFCCDRKYTTVKTYRKHIEDHDSSDKQHRFCVECNQTYYTEQSYAGHLAMVHTADEDKPFKCNLCSKAFIAEDLLNSHIEWHDKVEKLNHHCAICNKYFHAQGSLDQHNAAHHGIGATTSFTETTQPSTEDNHPSSAEQEKLVLRFVTFNCSKCKYIGKSFRDLNRHALSAHQITTNAVVCCEKRFHKLLRLYEHCLLHLDPDRFKCKTCGKNYNNSEGLQRHVWQIHTPVSERPYKCDICGDSFLKSYFLKYHMDRHLVKERKTYSCEECGKTYTAMLQLKSHRQRIHGAMSDWVCDVCAKGFAHRSLLEQHRITHTEGGLASVKIQCKTCRKWFANEQNYATHKNRCGNIERPIHCDLCDYFTLSSKALHAHKRANHTELPKFACSYCGKEFKKKIRLTEHEANHAGIVLYQCPFCPKMCNSNSNMYTHKKAAHPEEWAAMLAAKKRN